MLTIHRFKPLLSAALGVALLLVHAWVLAETDTPERIEWKKAPIRLELTVGEEQRIEFPSAVKVGVPASVQPLLRTQSVNGTVYLLAQAPFGSNRLLVHELDSGRIYLFDVTAAEEGGASHPLQIYVTGDSEPGSDSSPATRDSGQPQPSYIKLTQFAAQQLYAPARLVKDRPGIVRVPVARDPVDAGEGRCDRGGTAGGLARRGALCHRRQTQQPHRSTPDPGSARPARRLADGDLSASPAVAPRR